MRVALVNPNTNAITTATMVSIARAACSQLQFEGVTAESGTPLITEPKALRLAAQAVVALAPRLRHFDAVIVAAFSDPGREELARLLPLPVVGIGEASMARAAELSARQYPDHST